MTTQARAKVEGGGKRVPQGEKENCKHKQGKI
jgi:hypothetical protein